VCHTSGNSEIITDNRSWLSPPRRVKRRSERTQIMSAIAIVNLQWYSNKTAGLRIRNERSIPSQSSHIPFSWDSKDDSESAGQWYRKYRSSPAITIATDSTLRQKKAVTGYYVHTKDRDYVHGSGITHHKTHIV